ncbi:MAG: helix-turn-helix domain-containing protein [Sphingomonas sp.]|nr:helix-turn-helix domain-containing protein [Sphingomonas sp.]
MNLATRDAAAPDKGGVSVRIYRPGLALQAYVTFFYVVEVAGPLTDFLYPEWGNVRWRLSGEWVVEVQGHAAPPLGNARLFGPTDRPGRITTTGGKTIGFGMTPIGWHRLIGADAAAMVNEIVPLDRRLGFDAEAMLGALAADTGDRASIDLIEVALLTRLATRPEVGPQVLAADRALRTRPAEVADFAAAAGMSERTLHRVCLNAFGFAPKRLMRLQRFLDTLGQVRSAIGASVRDAIDDAYCDQSHFYRDFRDFMGMTPRAYFRAERPLMGPAAAAQIDAGVTLSFRLPPQPDDPGG